MDKIVLNLKSRYQRLGKRKFEVPLTPQDDWNLELKSKLLRLLDTFSFIFLSRELLALIIEYSAISWEVCKNSPFPTSFVPKDSGNSQPFYSTSSNSTIYIADHGKGLNCIHILSLNGEYKRSWRPLVLGSSQHLLNQPTGIQVYGSHIYIIDLNYLYVYETATGRKKERHKIRDLSNPTQYLTRGLVVDKETIYFSVEDGLYSLARELENRSHFFPPVSNLSIKTPEPLGPQLHLAMDDTTIFICDQHNAQIHEVNKSTRSWVSQWGKKGIHLAEGGGGIDGDLYSPSSIVIREDLLYITDLWNVQVFTRGGTFLQRIGYRDRQNNNRLGELLFPQHLFFYSG